MPSTPRKRSATSGTRSIRSPAAESITEPAEPALLTATAIESAEVQRSASAGRKATVAPPKAGGRGVGSAVGAVVALPFTVARSVAEDVVSTARRPEALVYWGGLVGMAALG